MLEFYVHRFTTHGPTIQKKKSTGPRNKVKGHIILHNDLIESLRWVVDQLIVYV